MLGLLLLAGSSVPFADDAWFDIDDRVDAVNDGALKILPVAPEKPVHHHFNAITVTEESLESGWIQLRQCHFNLDPVHALEIRYRPNGVRDLQIVSSRNVGAARVEGATVQLTGIAREGEICIHAMTRALRREGERFLLQNGPYMRRFLDGYYPMRITVALSVPDNVRVVRVHPEQSAGLKVEVTEAGASLSGWFEGVLYTRVWMCRKSSPNCTE